MTTLTIENIDVATPYNFAYHGYWVLNPTELNPRFGTEDDLVALITEVHKRDMYIMVDVVVNNIPSLSIGEASSSDELKAAGALWTEPAEFHPQCWIDYSNATSVEQCWLGDDKLPLMDVNTENETVETTLQSWIKDFVSKYNIDGLRIDAAKHVRQDFWPGFCGAAGVFCIGEVYGDDMNYATSWQTKNYMDSILGYPLYYGIVAGFGTPSGNMSHFVDIANQVLSEFPHPEYLGNFLENHDLPRWRNSTVDPQLSYNALVSQFIFEGIPTVYYGQEQELSDGLGDPYNRQALWPSKYTNTSTYERIKKINNARQAIIANGTQFEGKSYLDYQAKIIASTNYDVAIRKGPLLAMLTNRGSPSQDASFYVTKAGWNSGTAVLDVLSCKQYSVGSDQSLSVSYAEGGAGGMPYLFISRSDASDLHSCGLGVPTLAAASGSDEKSAAAGGAAAHPAVVGAGVLVLVAAGAFGRLFA